MGISEKSFYDTSGGGGGLLVECAIRAVNLKMVVCRYSQLEVLEIKLSDEVEARPPRTDSISVPGESLIAKEILAA